MFTKKFYKDLAERIISTFIIAVVAAWATTPCDFKDWETYVLGIVAAGGSAVKGLIAQQIGDVESASLVK